MDGQFLRAVGMMSGTSLDGVDAAWVETDGVTVRRTGMTVTMYYDLLPKKDMEPLQPLTDIFIAQGVIPKEAVAMHNS